MERQSCLRRKLQLSHPTAKGVIQSAAYVPRRARSGPSGRPHTLAGGDQRRPYKRSTT